MYLYLAGGWFFYCIGLFLVLLLLMMFWFVFVFVVVVVVVFTSPERVSNAVLCFMSC